MAFMTTLFIDAIVHFLKSFHGKCGAMKWLSLVNYIAIEMASFSLHLAWQPTSIHDGTFHA